MRPIQHWTSHQPWEPSLLVQVSQVTENHKTVVLKNPEFRKQPRIKRCNRFKHFRWKETYPLQGLSVQRATNLTLKPHSPVSHVPPGFPCCSFHFLLVWPQVSGVKTRVALTVPVHLRRRYNRNDNICVLYWCPLHFFCSHLWVISVKQAAISLWHHLSAGELYLMPTISTT